MLKQIARIWGVAFAEMRSARRLARTWIFIFIGLFFAFSAWLGLAVTFYNFSAFSPYVGLFSNARYMFAPQMGGTLILVYTIGIVFLAFDVHLRDRRDRVNEVLESRPLDNFSLLLGRTLGITLIAVIPIVITLFLMLLVILGVHFTDEFYLGSPQPHSFWQFLLIDLIPNMFIWVAFVVFLAMLIRIRLLVILLAISTNIILFTITATIPFQFTDVLNWLSAQQIPSDVEPFFTNTITLIERVAMIAFGVGLLFLAAMAQKRTDGDVWLRRTALGFGFVLFAFLGFFSVYWNADSQASSRADWLQAHQNIDSTYPTPAVDIEKLSGTVVVDPGSNLDLNYRLSVSVVDPRGTTGLLFSFNPTLEIESLTVDGQPTTDFSFRDGLLIVHPSTAYSANTTKTIELIARGKPSGLFAYLDAGIDLYGESVFVGTNLRLLGSSNLIFDSDTVALTSDTAWYPIAGPNINRDQTTRKPRDFFDVDLTISVPENWIVAGPGKRSIEDSQSESLFQLNPSVPLSSITLIADEFHRIATEIEGITFELLVHPKHTDNLALFGDIVPEIETAIAEHVQDAQRVGLDYPYGTLSLVEIPSSLKGFGGGWRMDSIQAQPGVLLLKELNFPTVSFWKQINYASEREWDDEGRKQYKLALLRSFLKNDLYGGNVFLGFVKNLFSFQTKATGNGAEALDYVTEALVNQLVAQDDGFFSAYWVADQGSQQDAFGTSIMGGIGARMRPFVTTQSVRENVFGNHTVWESAMHYALDDLPFTTDPEIALKVLELRGLKTASTIVQGLGQDDSGRLLGALLERFRGRTYTYEDVRNIAHEMDIPLDEVAGDWLNNTDLPGFLASPATTVRISDDESGLPRYATSVHIHNGELVPGVLTLDYLVEGASERRIDSTRAITVQAESSIKVNLTTRAPVVHLIMKPYFSLNRAPIEITIPAISEQARASITNESHRDLIEESNWRPEEIVGIVVDDLDAGFSTDNAAIDPIPDWLPNFFRNYIPDIPLDQGIPIFGSAQGMNAWMRDEHGDSFGAYRKTTARTYARGEGAREIHAYFKADIPTVGVWQLEYHLPQPARGEISVDRRKKAGRSGFDTKEVQEVYTFTLQYLDQQQTIEFDPAVGNRGWNRLGEFELPAAPVTLRVSNRSTGGTLFADAIRWSQKSPS